MVIIYTWLDAFSKDNYPHRIVMNILYHICAAFGNIEGPHIHRKKAFLLKYVVDCFTEVFANVVNPTFLLLTSFCTTFRFGFPQKKDTYYCYLIPHKQRMDVLPPRAPGKNKWLSLVPDYTQEWFSFQYYPKILNPRMACSRKVVLSRAI